MPATSEFAIYNVVIGTAGHIDHGKSSVVRRLTGIDPDRLPEEKEREMTIDIGFANFPLKSGERVGIIDVPGHEDFIKNMLAGATGIDIVLLVVSAVDGVMPQTVEHLRIMDMLGLKRGLIALNKCDAAEPDMADLVAEEIKDLVKGTFLDGAPILKVSAATGLGFDALYDKIDEIVRATPPREVAGVFRLPIQRIFTKKGFGTVITGVPVSGRAAKGDVIELQPLGRQGRIKALHAYGHPVGEIRAGHSSALNVSDVDHTELHRGDVAATPGYFKPTRFVEARFRFIADAATYMPEGLKVLKSFMPIKFHSGTKEAEGKIVILDRPKMHPGEEGYVQFRFDEPVVVAEGDPFIARIATPTYTIGGGRVVDVSGTKLKRFREEVVQRLEEKTLTLEDRCQFIEFVIRDMGFRFVDEAEVVVAAKAPAPQVRKVIERLEGDGKLVFSPKRKFIHADTIVRAANALAEQVADFHARNPLRAGFERLALRQESKMEDAVFELALARLVDSGRCVVENDRVRRTDFRPRMSKEEQEIAADLERIYRAGGLASPRLEEVYGMINRFPRPKIDAVVKILADQGTLVVLKDEVILHRDAVDEAKRKVAEALRAHGAMEPAKIRDVLGTTRKYMIPLLEHLDDVGLTRRVGNTRVLREPKK